MNFYEYLVVFYNITICTQTKHRMKNVGLGHLAVFSNKLESSSFSNKLKSFFHGFEDFSFLRALFISFADKFFGVMQAICDETQVFSTQIKVNLDWMFTRSLVHSFRSTIFFELHDVNLAFKGIFSKVTP